MFLLLGFLAVFSHAQSAMSQEISVSMSESEFTAVGNEVLGIFSQSKTQHGIALSLKSDWSDAWRNGRSSDERQYIPHVIPTSLQSGQLYYSKFFVFKLSLNTEELAAILCHEMSHVTGIIGYRSRFPIAAEGEADYVSGACLREYLSNKTPSDWFAKNKSQFSKEMVSDFALSLASTDQELVQNELAVRLHAALVAKSILQKSIRFRHGTELIDFGMTAPDGEVPFTICEYPSAQGRLDSVVAGILGRDRPRSWYHPDSGEFCQRTR